MAADSEPEQVRLRVHGAPDQATVVYLPGLHGDWTLVGAFRLALGGQVRFVEMTYPRTATWTLEDYAAGVERALAEAGIASGWVLAESFGSQVAWPLVARQRFHAAGLILAGGFGRHPLRWAVRLSERLCGRVSLSLLTRILFGYARMLRWRYRNSPDLAASLREFLERRTEADRQAAVHRLRLIAGNHPEDLARRIQVPVYALTGFVDPVVPWPFVRRWLRRNCPNLRSYRIIWGSDHNVLGTVPRRAAQQVLAWMQ
jgi:pimeloyl-ACP methyl ester carboxylesterase